MKTLNSRRPVSLMALALVLMVTEASGADDPPLALEDGKPLPEPTYNPGTPKAVFSKYLADAICAQTRLFFYKEQLQGALKSKSQWAIVAKKDSCKDYAWNICPPKGTGYCPRFRSFNCAKRD